MRKNVFVVLMIAGVTVAASWLGPVLHTEKLASVHASDKRQPTYQTRADIPKAYKWNLDAIYANEQEWAKDAKKVESLARSFMKHKANANSSPEYLARTLRDYEMLWRLHDKVYVYAKLALDVDASNPVRQERMNRADRMRKLVLEKTAWLVPAILAIPDPVMKRYLDTDELSSYRTFLRNCLRTKPHRLSSELEEVLAKSSALAKTPESAFSMLSKDLVFPLVTDETGKKVQLTPANFVSLMQSSDREVRKNVFAAYYQTIASYRDTFAQLLAAEVKQHNFYADVRKYDSALEASLNGSDVPVQVYDQLIQTVNKHLPLLHRYMELKKRAIGVDKLHMYDMYAPVANLKEPYIPYEQAVRQVIDGLHPLGKEYTGILQQGVQAGWIDVYPTKGKRPGAYHWGAYDTHPYVLVNYQGSLNDVATLAHELGHAMQSYYTNRRQPYLYADYPIFTAEVASTLNEVLLFDRLYQQANTRQEKIRLLLHHLENFRATLFRQTQFAEFEKMIHEKEANGESLHAEALSKLYLALNQKYYGPGTVSDEEIAVEWARIPHFYYNFYVYQYATSFAASIALAKQVIEEKQAAVERIQHNLLSLGSSIPPVEVLKASGIDMSTPEPINQAMDVFADKLDELERLLDGKDM